ncbi:MAG: outer membrane protein transport protein [Proteobacteria bacterium]|nr:outer membrane protein transport protein [Pseudomonadota bacterium]
MPLAPGRWARPGPANPAAHALLRRGRPSAAEVDAQRQPRLTTWSTYEQLRIDFLDNPELSSVEPKRWHNTLAVRLDAQYELLGRVPLPIGFAYDQTPVQPDTGAPELPDVDRLLFSGAHRDGRDRARGRQAQPDGSSGQLRRSPESIHQL